MMRNASITALGLCLVLMAGNAAADRALQQTPAPTYANIIYNKDHPQADQVTTIANTQCTASGSASSDTSCLACYCAVDLLCVQRTDDKGAAPPLNKFVDMCISSSTGKLTAQNVNWQVVNNCLVNSPVFKNATTPSIADQTCIGWRSSLNLKDYNAATVPRATFIPVASAMAALMLLAMLFA